MFNMQWEGIPYLTGEMRVDTFDVRLSSFIPQLHSNGASHSYPDGPGYLLKGGNKFFSLVCTTRRVEDGPDVQRDLGRIWIS